MDKISLISLLSVSIPETILILILGILAIGKFSYVKNKITLIRVVLSSIILSFLLFFIRRIVNSEIEVFLLSLFLCSLLSILILNLKFYESMLATFLGYIIFAVIQTVSVLVTLTLLNIKLDVVLQDNMLRFLFTLPERGMEILLVFFSLRYNIKIIDFETISNKRAEYYIQLFVYIISISTLIFLSIIMAKTLFFSSGDTMSATNTILLRVNVYLSLFITIILTLAIKSIGEHYKNKAALDKSEIRQSLEYLSSLVKEKNYDEASQAIETLKGHIKNS